MCVKGNINTINVYDVCITGVVKSLNSMRCEKLMKRFNFRFETHVGTVTVVQMLIYCCEYFNVV